MSNVTPDDALWSGVLKTAPCRPGQSEHKGQREPRDREEYKRTRVMYEVLTILSKKKLWIFQLWHWRTFQALQATTSSKTLSPAKCKTTCKIMKIMFRLISANMREKRKKNIWHEDVFLCAQIDDKDQVVLNFQLWMKNAEWNLEQSTAQSENRW